METKDIVLTITLKPDGSLDVSGPIHHKLVALGMLTIAKDLVLKYKPEEPALLLPEGSIVC